MSYTLDVKPAVMRRARACATRRGTTVDALVGAYLVSLAKREDEGERLARELDAFIDAQPRLSGAPYTFRRADAYDGVLA